ncbi:gas vesicle protein [[Kitasatospora] papulosa]|uniref:gas vesicle protein GvpO n=1 Tax=[Kitasatospora] papulosa TaxID=1464011 RepID=UPI00363056C4
MATEEGAKEPARRRSRITAREALRGSASQLTELTGREIQSVSAVQPTEHGWVTHVEVTEIERIPDTASVMATYRVELDSRGELLSYQQTQRYAKGRVDRN